MASSIKNSKNPPQPPVISPPPAIVVWLQRLSKATVAALCLLVVPAITFMIPWPIAATLTTAIFVFGLLQLSKAPAAAAKGARTASLHLVSSPQKGKVAVEAPSLNRHIGVFQGRYQCVALQRQMVHGHVGLGVNRLPVTEAAQGLLGIADHRDAGAF